MRSLSALLVAPFLAAFLLAGCSLAGRGEPAPGSESDPRLARASAEAYLRRFPEAPDRSSVLLRLALLHAVPLEGEPSRGAIDRERASELLERLLAVDPTGVEAPTARVVLALIGEQREVEAELAARREELEAAALRLDDLAELVSAKDAEVASRASEAVAKNEELAQLGSRLAAARSKLATCRAEVEGLVSELKELKRIDLSGPP